MNPLIEVLCNEITKIKKMLTTTGSDYTATVTKVEGDTAYVQIAGSDISDTPVALSVNADVGDHVRVRVANGKAWITGNDTLPPSNDKKAVATKMTRDMSDRDEDIVIDFGKMEFRGNTLVVDSDNFKLDEDGRAKFGGTLEAAGGSFNGALIAEGQIPDSVYIYRIAIADSASGNPPLRITRIIDDLTNIDYEFRALPDALELVHKDYYSTIQTKGRMAPSGVTFETKIYDSTIYNYNNYSGALGYDICRLAKYRDGFYQSYSISYDGPHSSSDYRLKEKITEIDPGYAKQLRPVRFQFKGDKKIRYGFIAQDVQKILPDVVSEEENGYLSLNYTDLIAPLYALVQEQEARIERLEIRLKALEEKR